MVGCDALGSVCVYGEFVGTGFGLDVGEGGHWVRVAVDVVVAFGAEVGLVVLMFVEFALHY